MNKHWGKVRELRRQTTKALATSYKSYVNNQYGGSLKTNPKRFWSFIKANKLPAYARAFRDVFDARLQWQGMVNLYKRSQFATQTQVTEQPNYMKRRHVDVTIIRYSRTSYFHVSYRRRM